MPRRKEKPAIEVEEVPQKTTEKEMSYVPSMVIDLSHQAYMHGFSLAEPVYFILKDGRLSISGVEGKKKKKKKK